MAGIRRIVCLWAALGLVFSVASASADVLPPEPRTTWKRYQEPSGRSIVAAGLCLSAAVVVAGLLASRLPSLRTWKAGVGGVTFVATLMVAGTAIAIHQRAEHDRAAWRAWEEQNRNRRQNWRPPPEFRDRPPIPAAPQSPSPVVDGQETKNPESE